jgi:hypothetical protein
VLLRVAHMAIVRGDFPLVFEIHQQVRMSFERLGQKSFYVRSLLNEMWQRTNCGDFHVARKLRDEAARRIAAMGTDGGTERERLHQQDAELAVAEGRGEDALRLVRDFPNRSGLNWARLEADALVLMGRVREAEDFAARTVREMSPKEDITDRTVMRCTLARAQSAGRKNLAAAETARMALSDGGVASQALDRMGCLLVLQKALALAKDSGAADVKLRAQRELNTLSANWPGELRRLFLNRPDMRRYLEEEN